MAEQHFDVWTSGAAYERYMGRWSRLVAREFLAWLDRADALRWLDVGCGTGVLSALVAQRHRPRDVLGCDRSEGFVTAAARAVRGPRFVVGDALALPVRDGAFDVAVSGLTLNFLPEPTAAVRELARAVRPGGLVAAYVWDYGDGMGLLHHFWTAAASADPAAAALDEARRFPDCRPEALHSLWTDAGLNSISTTPVEVPTVFCDFADLWDPFLAGQGPAPGYVASLTPAARDRLRDALRAAVPVAPDGSVPLTARAWAVRGVRP
ncbi:class I SAM-dependent methyltransferase [Streptomyces sp. uw30]|uniref:class I SAM-dependent methyltransferase n=1 Tax=Streptomyces sp. uw30 TaxID=1828179 RepID=UPI0011CE338C|nr:class I SAM-dependent methyltransferase [Streptomyces sp. uw30]TXS41880.1 class I SAM-dependent methyltransferase [Streptomyces sp. uw30]